MCSTVGSGNWSGALEPVAYKAIVMASISPDSRWLAGCEELSVQRLVADSRSGALHLPANSCRLRWGRAGCIGAVLIIGTLLAGLTTGCQRQHERILGKKPGGEPRTILAVRAGDTPPRVTLSGTMVEKCPVAGCWFRLRDSTGTIKVDTKSAGFVVVNVPLETKMMVTGNISSSSDEVVLEATGLSY